MKKDLKQNLKVENKMEESLKIKLCESKTKTFYKCEKCGLIAKNILLKNETT